MKRWWEHNWSTNENRRIGVGGIVYDRQSFTKPSKVWLGSHFTKVHVN